MKRNLLYTLLYIATLFLFYRCANVSVPSGGPRDYEAPKVLSENPPNHSVNFKGDQFSIEFNEFVNANNFSDQVMVSPSLKEKPQAKLKGKKIVISFKDTLNPNTTYSFYMGESIMDITEGNKLQGYKYAFSTGAYLDSLSLSGTVINAFDQSPMDKTWVMLYTTNSDSLIYNQIPYYLTKTNTSGSFNFTNLKNQSFYIAALKEENGNYVYDMPNEKIGFFKTAVSPTKTDTSKLINEGIQIKLFEEKSTKQFLKKNIVDYRKIRLFFNTPVSPLFKIKELRNESLFSKMLIERNSLGDSLTLWLPDSDVDSVFLELSDINAFRDTLEIPLLKGSSERRSGKTVKDELKLNLFILNNKNIIELNEKLRIESSSPIVSFDQNLIKIYLNDKEVRSDFIFKDSLKRFMEIPLKLDGSQKINIEILPGAFTDFMGLKNDSVKKEIKIREMEYYGNVISTIKVEKDHAPYIIQLTNEKGTIVQSKKYEQDSIIQFNYVAPGNYKLKAIQDDNNNGLWDTGRFLGRIMPENVIMNREAIIVRSNWDVEVEFDLRDISPQRMPKGH